MKAKLAVVLGIFALVVSARGQFFRVDPSFAPEIDGWVYAIAVQPNGKIMIGGKFTNVNGYNQRLLIRLNEDGSVDSSFLITDDSFYAGNTLYSRVDRIQIVDSKIYVTAYNASGLSRFDANGTLERGYPKYSSFAVDSQRRIIWGRQTERIPGSRVGRFNEDGSSDDNFIAWIGCCHNQGINAVAIQNIDGREKILIGGNFPSIDTNTIINLSRLNEDASLDTTFHVFGYYPEVSHIQLWRDGKFYVAGNNVLAKHLPDGNLDPTFEPSYGEGGDFVADIAIQSEGSVVIVGDRGFSSSLSRRFHPDGTRDTNFAVKLNNFPRAVGVDAAGRILIGGAFTDVNCIRRTYLVRLIPSDIPDPLPCVSPPPKPEPELTTTRLPLARMVCCWPTNYPEHMLQATRRLRPRQPEKEKWLTVTNTPVLNGDSLCVTNRIARWGRHYRLVKQ